MSRTGPKGTGAFPRRAPFAAGRMLRRASIAAALFCLISSDLSAEEKASSAFDWGFRLRLRQEYQANIYDFSEAAADDYSYLRVRSQLWGSWTPAAQWKIHAMLNNEHRRWYKSNKGLEDQPFEIHELLFENLYVEAKNLGGTPFGFVLGRQNLFYGEGFVCWDGGPLDGSRTAYFNALLFTAAFEKRRLEAHFISDPEQDEYLPVFNDQDQPLIEWNETGVGLYYTDESFESRKLEAYYFYKNEKDGDGVYPESDIHTIGARASGDGFERLTFAVEGAVQLGSRSEQDRIGYGGYFYGKYALPVGGAPSLRLGAFYLSGDDPGSADAYEGWDPVYSRWPKWSELYIYSLAKERGAAYWENFASLWFALELKPHKRVAFEEQIYPMWAPEPPPSGKHTSVFGAGSYRGTLSITKLSGTLNEYLSAYVLWEALLPGDYYADGGDPAHFLRWEIMFKY